MEELGSLFVAIGLLILLAATSLRYGVDSREGFRGRRGEFVPLGIVWDVPHSSPKPLKTVRDDETEGVLAPANCEMRPCAA